MTSGQRSVPVAIGVMTAWNASDHDLSFALAHMRSLLADEPNVAVATGQICAGLINLCGELLLLREREVGRPVGETLQRLGAHWAGGPAE